MKTFLFIAFIICMCLSSLIGQPIATALSWMMNAPWVAVLFLFLILISLIRLGSVVFKFVMDGVPNNKIKINWKKKSAKTTKTASQTDKE